MVNKVTENIPVTNDKQKDIVEAANKAANQEDLLSLFKQLSDSVSSNMDSLFKDTDVIINKASLEGINAEYSIAVQFKIKQCHLTQAQMCQSYHQFSTHYHRSQNY